MGTETDAVMERLVSVEQKLDDVLAFIEELKKVTESLSSNPMFSMLMR